MDGTRNTITSSRSDPPSSPIKYCRSGQTVRIPVTRIRCGKWDIRSEERWLEYTPTCTSLKIVFHDRQHFDHEECKLFYLDDISAADLRVTTKFGCLDAMNCVLTLECMKKIEISGSDQDISCDGSLVAELTFHVNYTGQVRDIMRSLRQAKITADAEALDQNEHEVLDYTSSKLREGLPDWVQYIPLKVYTPFFRGTIEFVLTFYTIFSILWALWQLYRHVDFIRAYVRPVIDMLISQIKSLDKLIQVANTVFEEFTKQWLAYLKPVYVIMSSFATPLVACGKQVLMLLSSSLEVVRVTFQPLMSIFQPCFHVLGILFIKAPTAVLKPMYDVFTAVWSVMRDILGQMLYSSRIVEHIKSVFQTLGEILERSVRLDPLKAQLILMRSNVLNSGKAVGLGMVYIYKSIERRVWLVFRRTPDEKED